MKVIDHERVQEIAKELEDSGQSFVFMVLHKEKGRDKLCAVSSKGLIEVAEMLLNFLEADKELRRALILGLAIMEIGKPMPVGKDS